MKLKHLFTREMNRQSLVRLGFRSWSYFRTGFGTYFSTPIGVLNTFLLLYIASQQVHFINRFFGNFWVFICVFGTVGVLASVFAGWLHFKRSRAYSSDMEISVEANPWNWKVTPGKEKIISVPSSVLSYNAMVLGTDATLLGYNASVLGYEYSLFGFDVSILSTESSLLNYDAAILSTDAALVNIEMYHAIMDMLIAQAKTLGTLTPEMRRTHESITRKLQELYPRFTDLLPRYRDFRKRYVLLLPTYRQFIPLYENVLSRYRSFISPYEQLRVKYVYFRDVWKWLLDLGELPKDLTALNPPKDLTVLDLPKNS